MTPDVIAIILAGFLLAAMSPWIGRFRYGGVILAAYPALVFLLFLQLKFNIDPDTTFSQSVPWFASLGVHFSFYIDGLSILFTLLISGIGVLVLLYAQEYLRGHPALNRFYTVLLLFMTSMLGVVLADNIIALFVFWELTSITSYFLIGFNHNQAASRRAALQALLVTGGGGLALLAGLLLFGYVAESFEVSVLVTRGDLIHEHKYYVPMLLLVLAGAFTKSAQFPFHFWLPNAMEAPTPVSAYLHSATMVKAGVYLLARFNPLIGDTDESHYIVTIVGAVTMLLGVVAAFFQTDLKKILAYTTISALGTLTLLLGLGTQPAAEAAMVFLLVHSLYKGALFLIAGIVDHESGTRNVEELGGMGSFMPITAAAALFAALSMAGLPPMLGFISKELLYEAKLQAPNAAWLVTSAGVLANMLAVAIAGLVTLRVFFGRLKITNRVIHDPPTWMWFGPVVLALGGFAIGLFPELISSTLITPAVSAVRAEVTIVKLALWHGINPLLALSVLTFAGGILIYVFHRPLRRVVNERFGHPGIADQFYERVLDRILSFSNFQTRLLQSGYLRRYVVMILLTAVVLMVFAFLRSPFGLQEIESFDAQLHEIVIVLVMLAATFTAATTQSRLVAIISLGLVGYGIAVLFVLFSAPDLAMTQLSIETLTVILFVLVLARLPRFVEYSPITTRMRDALLAGTVGMAMMMLVFVVIGQPFHPHVSQYFAENSVLLAKGRNIVNVILVDFRALDTLGEITVLALAAIGAYALLKLKPPEKKP